MASLFTFENLYRAYVDCRRKKRGKKAALSFEVNAEQKLLELTSELAQRTYRPSPSFCFVAKNDKHREVFAADFRDRIVHHFLVRRLEKIWEPIFIHDSYACRKGKGTHKAVERLRSFTRKVTANQTRRAWFAQLDIRAFFPSIDRQILLLQILSRLDNEELRWLSEIIIQHDPSINPIFTCSPKKWRKVAKHKSLFSVPEGKGLPIGNLTSQFFANVYLNSLDQFIKHSLKARYYLRYVDDLLLLDENRSTLIKWKEKIDNFLRTDLRVELHRSRQIIRSISNGINFAGYIVRPSHLYIRKKTVQKCKQAIVKQTKEMIKITRKGFSLVFPPDKYHKLYCTLNSYLGIFSHASSRLLILSIFFKFPILRMLFVNQNFRVLKKWDIPFRPANLYTQFRFFKNRFSGMIVFQVGCYFELFDKDAVWVARKYGMTRICPRNRFYARCGLHISRFKNLQEKLAGRNVLYVVQTGNNEGHVVQRVAVRKDWV